MEQDQYGAADFGGKLATPTSALSLPWTLASVALLLAKEFDGLPVFSSSAVKP